MTSEEELRRSIEWASKLDRQECLDKFYDLASYVADERDTVENCYTMMALLNRLACLTGAPCAFNASIAKAIDAKAVSDNAVAVSLKQLSLISLSGTRRSAESEEFERDFRRLPKDAQELVTRWNDVLSLPRIESLSGRMVKFRRSFYNGYFRAKWREGFTKLLASPFLTGSGKQRWKANIDWFLTPPNLENIISGQYDDRKHKQQQTRDYSKDEI